MAIYDTRDANHLKLIEKVSTAACFSGKVTGKARGKSPFLVPLHGAGGERHNGRRCELGIQPEFPHDADSAHAGHMEIEDDQIGMQFPRPLERFYSVGGLENLISALLQNRPYQLAACRLIIRYQSP